VPLAEEFELAAIFRRAKMGVCMKRFFLTTITIAALAGPATAADMAVKAPVPVSRPACAQFGGFYLGGHGGGTYYDHRFNDLDNVGYNGLTDIDNFGGFTNSELGWHAGAQAGWNWQTCCTVFGVQVDWSWSNAKNSSFHTDNDPDSSISMNSKMQWFGTARTRTGIVVDNLLLYVSGGFAFANFKRDMVFNVSDTVDTFSQSRTRVGLAVGAGTEWAFTPNWSLVGEFIYMGFKKDESTFDCTPCNVVPDGPFRFRFVDSVWVSRIGLNYRFGGAARGY
jgi:outer membrane immunogenic protein